jgi:hypothetical protein
MRVDLPAPGGPVTPMTVLVLPKPDFTPPCSMRVMARERARRSPERTASSNEASIGEEPKRDASNNKALSATQGSTHRSATSRTQGSD